MATQFQQTLSFNEIESMRQRVLSMLSWLNTNKYRVRTHDYRQITNHLQYVLTTFGNMTNILAVEQSDPYHSQQADYTKIAAVSGKKVIYNPDGSTRVIDTEGVHTTGEDWERQFDEGLLMKPPCYQLPPQNLTDINRIRKAANHQYDMMQRL